MLVSRIQDVVLPSFCKEIPIFQDSWIWLSYLWCQEFGSLYDMLPYTDSQLSDQMTYGLPNLSQWSRNRAQQPHLRNLRAQALAWQVIRTRSVWGSLAVEGGMPVWSVSQVQRLIRTKILKVYSFRDITCKYDIQELLKFTNCSSFQ